MSYKYLTPADVADMFPGCTEYYVHAQVRAGRWPHIVIARRAYFTAEQVAQIAELHTKHPVASIAAAASHGQKTRGSRTA